MINVDKKRGADIGIDGSIYYREGTQGWKEVLVYRGR